MGRVETGGRGTIACAPNPMIILKARADNLNGDSCVLFCVWLINSILGTTWWKSQFNVEFLDFPSLLHVASLANCPLRWRFSFAMMQILLAVKSKCDNKRKKFTLLRWNKIQMTQRKERDTQKYSISKKNKFQHLFWRSTSLTHRIVGRVGGGRQYSDPSQSHPPSVSLYHPSFH